MCSCVLIILFLVTTVAGSDYLVPSSPSVLFTLSGVDVQTECINITILDDDALQCEQDFTIEIVDITGLAQIIEPAITVVTIADNEGVFCW